MKSPPAISLPQGVRDILPEEAGKIENAAASILSVFERNGFKRIITPLLEYVDVLSLGMGENLKDSVLKFIDPSTGRVVAIRPDITSQIARVVATRMRDCDLPLKLCYNESVIRYVGPNRSKSREVIQIGAEYVSGEASAEADAEMISMAIEALRATGLKNFKIDIGDVGFLRTVLSALDIEEDVRQKIREHIALKDFSGLEAVLEGAGKGLGSGEKKMLLSLTTLYGEREVFKEAAGFAKEDSTKEVLGNLQSVFDIITGRGLSDFVTIDLGEVRGFDYYTGIIFEGFATGFGKPLLSGGRYDDLLERYGFRSAATGFAFDMENIVGALERNP
ncbi:MAG: ATP phosphoribosyltransferase regulatory subunit [Thermodesulfobacteriota bacterium]